MMISASGRIVAVLMSLCLGACAFDMGGDSGGSGATDQQLKTPGGIPYSRVCARTQCEADCEAATAEDCSECNAACWSVMTGTGSTSCIDTCASVCQPSCGCSDDSPCLEMTYQFSYPWAADSSTQSACKAAGDCLLDPGWCFNDSVVLDHEKAAQYYACEETHCDGNDDLSCLPAGGDLGQMAIATGCTEGKDVTFFNGWTQLVRPEVRETLEWCLSLGNCAEVNACVGGALYPYQ